MLMAGQKEKVIETLTSIAEEIIKSEANQTIDLNDLGTSFDFSSGYQPTLDNQLKRYYGNPVATSLRAGLRDIGTKLFVHASKDELIQICEKAAESASNPQSAQAYIESAWDGLTSSDNQTWYA